ncbi:MAG: hypothetical protein HLX46_02745 [Corynebacterium sp.]|uniref:hypothetical protein n=1 Tax=Corynebacterium sp. TaxID=1720 RepID=UPI0017DBFB44|nr:hypothetical protein [Corynebacterium sp.]NWO15768.1 hypothetical protein [Corynebacterium sp.]
MVNISIDVTDLGGEAHPGDKVIFWRPRVGGSATHAGRVISTAPHTVVLEDGTATVPDVEPGEMRVLLQCRGFESQEPIPVVVPDGTGTVTLRSLIESQFEYSPPIVSAVQQAADNAAASERNSKTSEIRSKQHADRAESIVDDAIANGAEMVRDEVKQDADRAVAARQAAESAKGVTETARDEAVAAAGNAVADIHDELDGLVAAADGHASRAEQAAGSAASDAVAQVRSELDGLVEEASQSKTAAATSETNAAQSESDAEGFAELAEQYKNAAEQHKNDAEQSKKDAAQSASSADSDAGAAAASASSAAQSEASAATHAGNALAHAERSEDARDESRLARDEAVQAAENAQQGAPSDGWKKAELSQQVQDSLSRADTALQSIPVATASAPGAIRLSGDLGGTAQAPTVPGLAGKADSVHTHTSSQVDGLDAALARLSNIRAWFRGEGPPPASIPGAQVGDWWLDETAMELHEITGV